MAFVILRAEDSSKMSLAPILLQTTQRLHGYLRYEGQLHGTQHTL